VCATGPSSTEADQLDSEAPSAVLLEHVDVGEVRLRVAVGQRSREADLLARVVETDDASGTVDKLVLNLARTPLCPVRLLAQVPMDGVAVDAPRVVVELVPAAEVAPHAVKVRRRKPP
jgi:hypothetical protein